MSAWEAHWDEQQAAYFYYNSSTQVTTWDKPEDVGSEPKRQRVEEPSTEQGRWEAHLDESSGNYYYHNPTTGETTWDKPEGEIVEQQLAGDGAVAAAEDGGEVEALEPVEGWETHLDPEAKKYFYYNPTTEETRWERPETKAAAGEPMEAEPQEERTREEEQQLSPEQQGVVAEEPGEDPVEMTGVVKELLETMKQAQMVGGEGGTQLREALSEHGPRVAIAAVQQANRLELGSTQPAVELLQFLGAKQNQVYQDLHRCMHQRTMEMLGAKPPAELEMLLASCFKFITVEGLREIPLAILAKMPAIRKEFVQSLSLPAIYPLLPHSVKRQIWHHIPGNFISEVGPVIQACAAKLHTAALDLTRFLHLRSFVQDQLEDLCTMIDASDQLYSWTVAHLCEQFVESKDPVYAWLRVGLIGTIQHSGQPEAMAADPLRKVSLAIWSAIDNSENPSGRLSTEDTAAILEGWEAAVSASKSCRGFPSAPSNDILNDTTPFATPPFAVSYTHLTLPTKRIV
eukprot:TRINITY_DN50017_c0_g2_i1.p1 TRINITY_DN50017_c0_g2~~TRINITY_DN50017_c0_g2_i1.p1  ORF type:complete len:514 (-),score=134.89 TRINITY_DN50017_c0_g2_i1:147-1688(-)